MDVDPDFNKGVRSLLSSTFPMIQNAIESLLEHQITSSRISTLAKEIGRKGCDSMLQNRISSFESRECLAHNDSHAFNVLVEKKPNTNNLDKFGAEGKYVLCDWEFSMAGPRRGDIGRIQAFPIACILAHALNGHVEACDSILDILRLLWGEYASTLKSVCRKDDEYIRLTYRNCIGWVGDFIFGAYYLGGFHMEFLPLENKPMGVERVKESLGYLGLQFMRIGFGNDEENASLSSLYSMFKDAIMLEVELQLAAGKLSQCRRSSALRSSGRLVSDAALYASLNEQRK